MGLKAGNVTLHVLAAAAAKRFSPETSQKRYVSVKVQLLKMSTVYSLAAVGVLFVMISTVSSNVPLRSEVAWSRPLTEQPGFTCRALPQSFLFHSAIFSSLDPCSTLSSHLCPRHRLPTHPLPQLLTPLCSLPTKHYFIHDFLVSQNNSVGWRNSEGNLYITC